jgi:MFS family permease
VCSSDLWTSGDDFRLVFWVAVIPAVLAVLVLAFGVREPPRPADVPAERQGVRWVELRALGRPFAVVMAFTLIVSFARFGEAFLVLQASVTGLAATWVPVVLMVMNLVYALSAYPAGALADRIGRRGLLAGALGALALADMMLAMSGSIALVLVGVALWGLHMGLSQGLLSAWVADVAPPSLRGTAFGVFHLTVGLGTLLGNVGAGVIWHYAGPTALFAAAALLAVIALPIGWHLMRPPVAS